MTQKHFKAFAAQLKADLETARTRFPAEYQQTYDAVNYAAQTFATIAANDNPRFDRDRFLTAAGVR